MSTNVPVYVGAIAVVGTAGILGATSAALYRGSQDSGASRKTSTTVAVASAVFFAIWAVASSLFAEHGGYHTQFGKQPPWLAIQTVGSIVTLMILTRVPAVSRALSVKNAVRLLSWPHLFRIEGVSLIIAMLLGHLPALFAIPAGLGDIAIGIAEPYVTRRIKSGDGRRAAKWFNILGIADLANAFILGGLTGYGIVHVTPVHSSLAFFPLALVPAVGVPLLLVLHVLTLRRLRSPLREPLTFDSRMAIDVA